MTRRFHHSSSESVDLVDRREPVGAGLYPWQAAGPGVLNVSLHHLRTDARPLDAPDSPELLDLADLPDLPDPPDPPDLRDLPDRLDPPDRPDSPDLPDLRDPPDLADPFSGIRGLQSTAA